MEAILNIAFAFLGYFYVVGTNVNYLKRALGAFSTRTNTRFAIQVHVIHVQVHVLDPPPPRGPSTPKIFLRIFPIVILSAPRELYRVPICLFSHNGKTLQIRLKFTKSLDLSIF